MRGRILVKFGYFLLIFVNVVPFAITKHGAKKSGHHLNNGNNHGHKHHSKHSGHHTSTRDINESDESLEKGAKHNRHHHDSSHHNSGHHNYPHNPHNPSHQHNHQNSGKENHQKPDTLQCKCDNILACECDSALAQPSAIGNFSCKCADNKSLYSKGNPINCNCLKNHLSAKHLVCQCIQNNGASVDKIIECPEAVGYLIETDERLIDFSGINRTVHISDKTKTAGQMRIRENIDIQENFGTTIPSVPKFPDDITLFPTSSSTKQVTTTTTVSDFDVDVISTTPIPSVPTPPNDEQKPPIEPVPPTDKPVPLPGPHPETSPAPPNETTPPPIETPEPLEPPTETPEPFEPPTETPEPLEPPTETPELPDTEPPTEIPSIPPTSSTTPKPLVAPVLPPPEFPKPPPGDDCPKPLEVNWTRVKDDYYFWIMIIEITEIEFKYVYKTFVKHFEDEELYLCNGTYVNGHVTCNSNENTEQCTKENRCNCMCVGQKLGNKIVENCFCNQHVLQPTVKYPTKLDLKGCRCYNPSNKGNSLICDCNKVHSADKIEPLIITELHIIDISIIIPYLVQFNFGDDINICGCVFYNGKSNCNCKDDTDYYTEESTVDCLCFYMFKHGSLIGHCYCVDGLKEKHIDIKYNKDVYVVQTCSCYNYENEGTSLICSCEEYLKPEHDITYNNVLIDLSQLQQITFNIILNYFLRIYEFRYEHFGICACKLRNGETSCGCFEPVLHCTQHKPCSCLSVYQYQQGHWIRLLFCNPHILEPKYKFNELTTQVDHCFCRHSNQHKLICKCGTIFSIDSSQQIVDFNKAFLDISKIQFFTRETLLNSFSQVREYHNETFSLADCAYLSNSFQCIGLGIGSCTKKKPCKCLCKPHVLSNLLGAQCICNPHVEESKIDYNPANFELHIFTCIKPMKAFLQCDHMKKESVNYKFTTTSIIENYLEKQPSYRVGQRNISGIVNSRVVNSGGTTKIIYTNTTVINGTTQGGYWQSGSGGSMTSVRVVNSTVPGGEGGANVLLDGGRIITQGSSTSQVHMGRGSMTSGHQQIVSNGQTIVTHGNGGVMQGGYWQSGGSGQVNSMKFNSAEEMQQYLKLHGGGKTIVTQTQSGPIQVGGSGQVNSMKFNSAEEMQQYLKLHGGGKTIVTQTQSGPIQVGGSGQVNSMKFNSAEEMQQYLKLHGGGKTIVTQTQSGPIQVGGSGQVNSMKFNSAEEMQQYLKLHGGGKTIVTQTQSGPIQVGGSGQVHSMKFNSAEEMQKYLKLHGGDGKYKVKQIVQKIPADGG